MRFLRWLWQRRAINHKGRPPSTSITGDWGHVPWPNRMRFRNIEPVPHPTAGKQPAKSQYV